VIASEAMILERFPETPPETLEMLRATARAVADPALLAEARERIASMRAREPEMAPVLARVLDASARR
jgi:hypothetical protein